MVERLLPAPGVRSSNPVKIYIERSLTTVLNFEKTEEEAGNGTSAKLKLWAAAQKILFC